jgi:hypothetical protein
MADTLPDLPPVTMAPGRSCAGCTLCCKLLAIPELNKPARQWCEHCDVGVGCKIYETRPAVCAAFYCQYRIDAAVPETWKPSVCSMVLHYNIDENRLDIHLDPSRPDAWRTAPYYGQAKAWAQAMLSTGGLLVIWDGANATAVLPDREVDLGPYRADHVWITTRTPSPQGVRYDVQSLHKDDPRLRR